MLTARSAVAAADDFIATRRGAVGPEARTRLAEAQRHLDTAGSRAAADPVAALGEAQQADRLAQTALSLAQGDVEQWSQQAGYGGYGPGYGGGYGGPGYGGGYGGPGYGGGYGPGYGGGYGGGYGRGGGLGRGLGWGLGGLVLGGLLFGDNDHDNWGSGGAFGDSWGGGDFGGGDFGSFGGDFGGGDGGSF
jgi:hypothetical protein